MRAVSTTPVQPCLVNPAHAELWVTLPGLKFHKRGTAERNISLVLDIPAHIEGRVHGQQIVILTQFVKKSAYYIFSINCSLVIHGYLLSIFCCNPLFLVAVQSDMSLQTYPSEISVSIVSATQ